MRKHVHLNFDWKYRPDFKEDYLTLSYSDFDGNLVQIPHTNRDLPLQYFDEKDFCFTSCYKKQYFIEGSYKKQLTYLRFEGVASYAKVYVNGQFVGEHRGGYTPFQFLIDQFIQYDEFNDITVMVDSSERQDIPPFGGVIDYLTYGGIYREVSLNFVHKTYIKDTFIKTKNVTLPSKEIQCQVTLEGLSYNSKLTILFEVFSPDGKSVARWTDDVSNKVVKITKSIEGVQLWDIHNPTLYQLQITLKDNEAILDETHYRFGFREAVFKENGFYLNGNRLKLRGLNRHQSYPYVGYAMPSSAQIKDADILKFELGCNIVRTSHYPQSTHFLNRCDEIGLLVFTEIPGWQHISKDEMWRKTVLENVEEMILRDRNHPSIILWGVRINESPDDDALYRETNRIAHELDDMRQTGGVRNFDGSHLLEDVYTYNDFVHKGDNKALENPEEITKDNHSPYLITEHNGHMFPTKSFDTESKRLEHALRHMRVINQSYAHNRISGVIGWCMFDYHTHKDFGSGDKVCYHGVLDMFRIPKIAAGAYASQQDEKVVMEVSSTMNLGDHSEGRLPHIYVFTNCDYVKLYKGDTYLGAYYPDRENFANLPHPPIIIKDLIGDQLIHQEHFSERNAKIIKEVLLAFSKFGKTIPLKYKIKMLYAMAKTKLTMKKGEELFYKYVENWGDHLKDYRFEGYKKDQSVKTVMKSVVTQAKLQVKPDSNRLVEDSTYDVTRIVIKAVDENGNTLNYASDVIHITCQGPIQVIGESQVALTGGVRGFYIKTKGQAGEASVIVSSSYLGEETLKFSIDKSV